MNRSAKRRVAVTGLGSITSLGHDVQSYWAQLVAGESGIDKITSFDASPYGCQVGSEVKDFDPSTVMDPKEVKRNDRYVHLAMSASKEAFADSGLNLDKIDKSRFGVIISSGIGGMDTIEKQSRALYERGPRRISPFMIPMLIANMGSGIVAIEFGAMGPNFSVVTACAGGSHALGEAMRSIALGDADIMIAGGSEAAVTVLGYAGFCSMKAMSTSFNDEPKRSSRPFDAQRDGFIMGEGAGILVLEELEHARARGARIYCELAGYGASCDAYHITSPHPEGKGLAIAATRALGVAGLEPSAVDYINAHGTSTPLNDKFETAAVKSIFGEHAPRIPMSSTKSMTGHLLGAAGGIEAVACAKAIETGILPPTINLENPDPDCDLDYVPNEKREVPIKVAMSNNLGFGGHNASLVFRAIQ
ncbi:MAG TPA: beta-ketoacyl-[acyl-carrier-protein] synthase II [Opitutae bacterium]|nr:beta-ketoacyl-[acyl-carrier-protein] synthase II [Opitutae bacterium]|tara:strand:- start:719 stop:1972 length:1254 start_codon:yes stop_codon:yes gene_type:complete